VEEDQANDMGTVNLVPTDAKAKHKPVAAADNFMHFRLICDCPKWRDDKEDKEDDEWHRHFVNLIPYHLDDLTAVIPEPPSPQVCHRS
jgi:hypothetical protein